MYNYAFIKDKETFLNKFEPSGREVIFMLRGLSRSYKGWLGLEDELSEKYDVICADLPGVGISRHEKHLFSIEEMAAEFIEIIEQLGLKNFYIVAPSLGSLITYEIARKLSPDIIAGLLIIVPSHSGFGVNRLSTKGIRTLASASFVSKEVKLALLKELLIGKTAAELDPFEDVHLERRWRNQIWQDFEELGAKGQLAQVLAAAKYTSRQGLLHIKKHQIPLKVMISTGDLMIPITHKKGIYEFLKHPYSELIEMKHAGHDFVVTHKEQVKEVIDKLIAEKELYQNRSLPVQVIRDNKSKSALFFLSTVVFGTLMYIAARKYKKKP